MRHNLIGQHGPVFRGCGIRGDDKGGGQRRADNPNSGLGSNAVDGQEDHRGRTRRSWVCGLHKRSAVQCSARRCSKRSLDLSKIGSGSRLGLYFRYVNFRGRGRERDSIIGTYFFGGRTRAQWVRATYRTARRSLARHRSSSCGRSYCRVPSELPYHTIGGRNVGIKSVPFHPTHSDCDCDCTVRPMFICFSPCHPCA